MAKYQGHRSWNAWNVSLWINNNEPLYRWALEKVRKYGRKRAAGILAGALEGEQTPDGGKYNRTCLYEAMEGMSDD